jgi:glutaconyl-CoA decarboxylase
MKYKVTLNGRTYEVEVETDRAILVDEYEAYAPAPAPAAVPAAPAAVPAAAAAPAAAAEVAAGERVNAPMPGNILKVEVNKGDKVKAGQLLVILEAMKMENEIVAPKAGTVAQVVVKVGEKVDTGATLVVLA